MSVFPHSKFHMTRAYCWSVDILDHRGATKFIHTSASTITHLSLPMMIQDYFTHDLRSIIDSSFTFPHLLNFECGVSLTPDIYGLALQNRDTASMVTRFLSKHPTIQVLHLHCGRYCHANIHCDLDSELIEETFLPNLKVINAHLQTISTMALSKVQSLLTVEEVITGGWTKRQILDYASPNPPDEFRLVTILENLNGGLPNVKRVTCNVPLRKVGEHHRNSYTKYIVSQMKMMAGIFPSLEDWAWNEGVFAGLHGVS